uniref:Uncharacterized protein n=1 Tax=viral metagenome TaxID=1070528 RepID=A0A6M3M5N1_9ZZZZ
MVYTICDYSRIKETFPEFQATMDALEDVMVKKALADWAPLKYGGLNPKAGEFGKTTIMPELFQAGAFETGALTLLPDWDESWIGTTMTVPGHNTIMQGANSGNIYEDYKVGIVGLAFLEPSSRISEIKMQISDKKLPRMNIQEAWGYQRPCIIFENGYVLDEETGFHLYGYCLAEGPAKIKLIGVQLNRVPNKLQSTNTGAALS